MAATVGTNSYISVADADAYFTDSLSASAWSGATAAEKEAALVTAARRIDRLLLAGIKADSEQALEFPRCYVVQEGYTWRPLYLVQNTSGRYGSGRYICDSTPPPRVLDATCEEALALLEEAADPEAATRQRLQRQGVESVSLGSLSESYSGGGRRRGLASAEASGLMRPYVAGAVAVT